MRRAWPTHTSLTGTRLTRACIAHAVVLVAAACGRGGASPVPSADSTAAVPGAAAAAATPVQYVVGIDISASRTPTQLAEGRRLLDGVIDRMTHGDRVVLVETYQAGTDAARQWTDSIPALRRPPEALPSERRRAAEFRDDAKGTAAAFLDPERAKQIRSTDVFGTLARAADYARAARGRRTTVLLLSDMIQSTPEVNMERAGSVPGAAWIAGRRAQDRLPDLRGVCVVVAGADVRTARGATVREFWRRYFAATGADFQDANYRNMIADAAEVRCDG